MIIVLLFLLAFVGIFFGNRIVNESAGIAVWITGGVSFLIAVVLVFVAIGSHIGVDANVAMNQARYDSLLHQAESKIYENDNDLGKKELADQIQQWNEELAKNKALQRDFWLGVFYPNIYDNFEFIPVDLVT